MKQNTQHNEQNTQHNENKQIEKKYLDLQR